MRVSLVFNRKGKTNKKGLALVQLRAYQGKKSKYFSTGVYLLPRQWKNDKVIDHPNSQELNLKLKNLVTDIEEFILQLTRLQRPVGFAQIDQFFRTGDIHCFHEFCSSEMEKDNALSPSTKKHHRVTLNYLKQKFPKLKFDELNYSVIHDFNNFLKGKGLSLNTIHGHHRRIKRYINLAKKKELLPDRVDPYRHFTAKTSETKRDVLTKEEIARLEALEMPETHRHLQAIKDMFLFGCYTGLRFSDIVGIQRSDLHLKFDQAILKLTAQKTGKHMDLPLHLLHDGKPARLIREYAEIDHKKQQLFPRITNQYANRCLKEISAQLGTNKKITMHVARHTFATHLALKVRPALLQQLLQHSKIETTMIYVHLSEQMLLEELKKINW